MGEEDLGMECGVGTEMSEHGVQGASAKVEFAGLDRSEFGM